MHSKGLNAADRNQLRQSPPPSICRGALPMSLHEINVPLILAFKETSKTSEWHINYYSSSSRCLLIAKMRAMKRVLNETLSQPDPYELPSISILVSENHGDSIKTLYSQILAVKFDSVNISDVILRMKFFQAGIPYTVVRPCGLNDDHPRGRPFFSVGDTAAGRISRCRPALRLIAAKQAWYRGSRDKCLTARLSRGKTHCQYSYIYQGFRDFVCFGRLFHQMFACRA